MSKIRAKVWILIGTAGLVTAAASAQSQDNNATPPIAPPVTPPSQPVLTQPKVEPLKIERPRYSQNSGFSRPSGFTYQGPKNFSRPFNNGYMSNSEIRGVPYYPPRADPAAAPAAAPQGGSPGTSSVGASVKVSGVVGGNHRYSDARRAYAALRDPFSTRYPINESTHTVVAPDGRIITFTTSTPLIGYGSSYNRRRFDGWAALRYDSRRFRARAYLNNGMLYDPCRYSMYAPVEEIYLAPGVGTAEVFMTPTMTIEEHRAANSSVIPGSGVPPQADPDPAPLDLAIIALDAGHPEVAIPHVREHLMVTPDDMEVRRLLAICLILDKDLPQGLAELAGAYAQDPGLASAPVDIGKFKIRRAALTEATSRLIGYSKRGNSPLGYFGAAVIQQARGETAAARKMIELATQAGLDRDVTIAMAGALAGNPGSHAGTK